MSLLYVRPDESFMFGSVTGTVDDTYLANWLVNGSPGYPVSGATGLTLTVTALASRTVSLVAIVNHNLTGTVAISGGVTATIPAATIGADDIPLNSFVSISPVPATSLVMTVAESPSIVGELIAGTARTLQRQLKTGVEWDPGDSLEWEGEFSSLPPYDRGLTARRLTGETLVNQAGLEDIQAWWLSTRKGSRPTLIVPIDRINDPWLVTFSYRYQTIIQGKTSVHPGIHRVQFEFSEIPRVRWPA